MRIGAFLSLMGKGVDKHRKDLVCRLFVLATEILEDTHEFAAFGQWAGNKPQDHNALNIEIRKAAADLDAIAGAIAAALRPLKRPR